MNRTVLTIGLISAYSAIGYGLWNNHNEVKELEEHIMQLENIQTDIDKTYDSLDKTLQTKDIPGFVMAYEKARRFAFTLQDEADTKYLTENDDINESIKDTKHDAGYSLSRELRQSDQSIFPVLYEWAAQNPTLLENWPADCDGDETSGQYIVPLIAFGQKKIDMGKKKESEDWLFQTTFSDDTLAAKTDAKTLEYTANWSKGEPEGRYAPFSYRVPAQAFTFAFLDVTDIGLSGRTIDYVCNVIDLGADGIDTCDARINGISVEQIPEANKLYRECMKITSAKLQERYPTEI